MIPGDSDKAPGKARADAWWEQREQHYQQRPGIREETGRIRAETQRHIEQQDARLRQLEARAEADIPGADQALMEAYTLQSLETGPPEPSAKDDPEEWRAFFREEYGRDMPLNAEYEAQKHRIEAAAPADVGEWPPPISKLITPAASMPPTWRPNGTAWQWKNCSPTTTTRRSRNYLSRLQSRGRPVQACAPRRRHHLPVTAGVCRAVRTNRHARCGRPQHGRRAPALSGIRRAVARPGLPGSASGIAAMALLVGHGEHRDDNVKLQSMY